MWWCRGLFLIILDLQIFKLIIIILGLWCLGGRWLPGLPLPVLPKDQPVLDRVEVYDLVWEDGDDPLLQIRFHSVEEGREESLIGLESSLLVLTSPHVVEDEG